MKEMEGKLVTDVESAKDKSSVLSFTLRAYRETTASATDERVRSQRYGFSRRKGPRDATRLDWGFVIDLHDLYLKLQAMSTPGHNAIAVPKSSTHVQVSVYQTIDGS